MTWREIIDTDNIREYIRKSETQNYVYVIYSPKPPYLPIDIAYSLYEISLKYGVELETLKSEVYRSSRKTIGGYIIKKVLTD